jgi:hypothetical protein
MNKNNPGSSVINCASGMISATVTRSFSTETIAIRASGITLQQRMGVASFNLLYNHNLLHNHDRREMLPAGFKHDTYSK